MKLILETGRLILRELTVEDARNMYELNLNPNVIKYTGNSAFESVSEARAFLENYNDYRLNGYGRWAVIEKATGNFLGWCGLKYDAASGETDIGFRFFEETWGKGFATESAGACIEYGFRRLQLKSIVGRAMKENTASIKVLEKIGLNPCEDFDFDGHEGVILKIDINEPELNP